MTNILGQEQVNIARISGVDIVDLTVQNSQDNNNKDLYFWRLYLIKITTATSAIFAGAKMALVLHCLRFWL